MSPTGWGKARIGTSGWIYKHWKQLFYPPNVAQRQWLDVYADTFDTVEINFTFYRLPTAQTFASWNQRARPGFDFALKGSRYVTHLKQLHDAEPHVKLFFDRAASLRQHTGPILWQLPPRLSRDDDRLAAFLDVLPKDYDHALEFRHDSWFVEPVRCLLRERNVALCVADSVKRPGTLELTTKWTYIRFHQGQDRGSYTEEQLRHWSREIERVLATGINVWIYFNNDPEGHAIFNARRLMSYLDVRPYDRSPAAP